MGNVTLAVEDVRDVWAMRVLDGVRQDVRARFADYARVQGSQSSPSARSRSGSAPIRRCSRSSTASSCARCLCGTQEASCCSPTDRGRIPCGRRSAARTDLFDGAFAWSRESFDLARDGRTAPVDGAYVSGRFFDVLGVPAFRGRMLTPADDSAAPPDGPVAVISHRFWRQHFGGADDVVGRQLTVQVQRQRFPFTIVGVMPPGFSGVDVGRMADVMLPFAAEPLMQGRESVLPSVGMSWLEMMVRLKPGQTIDQANAALRSVQPQIRAAVLPGLAGNPAFAARYLTDPLTLAPAAAGASRLRRQFETPLFAMVVAVGLVLLVACANIASLLLARALARRGELSVRLALGGSRWRLARLLFIESLLVAMTGAALGLVFARWSSALLVQQLGTWESTVSLDLALDWRVLVFTATLACLCAISAGVAPMIAMKSVAPGEALKSAGRAMAGDRRFAVRGAARRGTDRRLVRPGHRRRTLPAHVRIARSVAAWLRARAAGGRPDEPVRERHSAGGSRRACRAPSRRGGGDARREVGIRFSRRLLTGGGWFTNNMVAVGDGPMLPEDRRQSRLAERHHAGLVRDDGHTLAERAGLQRPRSCRQSARSHRQRGVRAPVSVRSTANRPDAARGFR